MIPFESLSTLHQSFLKTAFALSLVGFLACSSSPEVHTESYAALNTSYTFEKPLAEVWKSIEKTCLEMKIKDTEREDAKRRYLASDWIYTQSKNKYVSYEVNGVPKRRYLQMRLKYRVEAQSTLAGTLVNVSSSEEIETVDTAGNPKGYEVVGEPDTSRPKQLLDKIKITLNSMT